MTNSVLNRRLHKAKQSFATRRLEYDRVSSLVTCSPKPGDLCLARIDRLGHHSRLELVTGRRAHLNPGDEVILTFGARYATDQFHSVVPNRLNPCQMVAAGGIASELVSRHAKTRIPTQISPIGLLADRTGSVLNLRDFAIKPAQPIKDAQPHIMCVVGSSMNAGKTTLVAELGRMAIQGGLQPCAIKLTGTGSGGDLWKFIDNGIDPVFDFSDGGYATTVDVPVAELEDMLALLLNAAGMSADLVIIEIADGVYQKETAGLLASRSFRERLDSILFAAADPMSGVAGVKYLRDLGLEPSGVSGAVTASPLAAQELAAAIDIEVLTIDRLLSDDSALSICMRSAHPMGSRLLAKFA